MAAPERYFVDLDDGSTVEVWAESEAEAASIAEAGPSPGQAMLQGALVEAPTTYGALADVVEGGFSLIEDLSRGHRVMRGIDPGPRIMADPGARDLSKVAREAGKRGLASIGRPYHEPRGAMRYLQRGTGGAIAAAPFALAPVGPFGPAARTAFEMMSGATGEMSSQAAQDLGFGPTGQAVAGMAGALAPGAAAAVALPVARDLTTVVPGFQAGAANRAVQELLAESLSHGDPSRLARAGEMLAEEEAAWARARAGSPTGPPGPADFGRASSVQALEPEFPQVGGIESSLGRQTPRYQGRLSDLRSRNMGEIEARAEALAVPVEGQRVRQTLLEEMERNAQEEQAAYARVDELGVRGTTEPLHRELRRQEREMGIALAPEVPAHQRRVIRGDIEEGEGYTQRVERTDPETGEVTKVTEPAMVELQELHNFRKKLNADLNALTAKPEGNEYKIRNLVQFKKAVDDALEETAASSDLGQEQVGRLRDAIRLMHEYESVYSGHPALDAFVRQVDRPEEAIRTLVKQPNAQEEAKNLRLALRGDKQAEEGLKRLYVRYLLLGEAAEGDIGDVELWIGKTKMAQRRLAKTKLVGREILGGEEGVRSLQRFLARSEQLAGGPTAKGTAHQTVGSGYGTLEMIGAGRPSASGAMGILVDRLQSRYRDQLGELLETALIEPRVMRLILEKPVPPSQFEAWATKLEDVMRKTTYSPITARGRARQLGPARYPARGIGAQRGEEEQ